MEGARNSVSFWGEKRQVCFSPFVGHNVSRLRDNESARKREERTNDS